jgi:hypothetical protein
MFELSKSFLKGRFPRTWQIARSTGRLLELATRFYGYEPRECPICGARGKFIAEVHFPDIFNFDAICPNCGSLPRNRLLKLAVDRRVKLSASTRLLHFAPEAPVTSFIKERVGLYVTADLFARGVDLQLNIESIDQPDQSWDVVICSHVLEHVDHHRALRELHRILAPHGTLLALFPIVEAWPHDYEAPEVQSRHDRALHFGKENHMRRFGRSMRDEIVQAGFELETFAPIGPEVVRYGLIPGETVFIGRRA